MLFRARGFGLVLVLFAAEIEQIQKWVNEFGYLVVYDTDLMEKDPNLKPLLDTFPEVLSVGTFFARAAAVASVCCRYN